MLRYGFATAGLICASAAQAQVPPTAATIPPQYAGVQTRVGGVFVTPIPNIPFSAMVQISSTRLLPDGSSEMRKTENRIARNSQGVIYNEMRRMMPVAFQGMPPLTSSHVYDPGSGVSTFWEPTSNVARSTVLPPQQMRERKPFTLPLAGAVDTDLGESTMSGVGVHGLRRTFHIDATQGGTLKPLVVTDEYWYSEDLHLVMLQKHDDSRTGEQIVVVTAVQRTEPDAKQFAVPEGYRIVDLTPDAVPVRSTGKAGN
ncbi:MAG: hypothetical protein ACRYGF_04380 [Janthinobacterium lividum]